MGLRPTFWAVFLSTELKTQKFNILIYNFFLQLMVLRGLQNSCVHCIQFSFSNHKQTHWWCPPIFDHQVCTLCYHFKEVHLSRKKGSTPSIGWCCVCFGLKWAVIRDRNVGFHINWMCSVLTGTSIFIRCNALISLEHTGLKS